MKELTLSNKSHSRFVETAQSTFVELFSSSDVSKVGREKNSSEVQTVLRICFDISKDVMQKCPRLHDFHVDLTLFLYKIQGEMSAVDSAVEGRKNGEGFSFYHDACVEEAKKCVPVLVDTKQRVVALLEQWPGTILCG